jgi:hypothetical protein
LHTRTQPITAVFTLNGDWRERYPLIAAALAALTGGRA